jgi:hypothetical protein
LLLVAVEVLGRRVLLLPLPTLVAMVAMVFLLQ